MGRTGIERWESRLSDNILGPDGAYGSQVAKLPKW